RRRCRGRHLRRPPHAGILRALRTSLSRQHRSRQTPYRPGDVSMSAQRYVIVNADGFGRSPGVNRGIVAAHERGIVTSASLMVRWDAAAEAAAYGREHPEFSLGLHLDLGEWACREGPWGSVSG